jgi:hypothetical protein
VKQMLQHLSIVAVVVAATMAMSVTAASAAPPQVQTQAASVVGPHTVTLRGKVHLEVGDTALAAFEYGKTTAYGTESDVRVLSERGGIVWYSVEITVTGLEAGTTYHNRLGIYSSEWDQVFYGEDATFTTKAPGFWAGQYPATLSAVQVASDPLVMGLEGGTLTCSSVTASGVLKSASQSITLTPSFSGCQILGLTATVSANGCTYVVNGGASTSDTMDIVCPEGKAITASGGNCAASIPAQAGLSAVTARDRLNSSPQQISLSLNVVGLTYNKTNDGFLCKFNGTGTKTDGTYSGTALVAGTNGAGEAIAVGAGL